MQRQQNVQGFNKEKMTFVVAGLVCAAGLYYYLASEPVLLGDKKALSAEAGPLALQDASLENPQHESFYVVDGKITIPGAVPDTVLMDIIERVVQPSALAEAPPEAGPTTPTDQPKAASGGKIILP